MGFTSIKVCYLRFNCYDIYEDIDRKDKYQ
jgi:hypothetical protein